MEQAAVVGAKLPSRRGAGGRPTREEAARRDARIVDVAMRLFIERGYDATSIEAVAEAAGVGKPTLYARYRDKRALFEAVLEVRVRDWLAPLFATTEAQALGTRPKAAEAVLDELSRTLLARSQDPGAAALTRCIAAQALQFPDLARLVYEEGWLRGVRTVGCLLGVLAAQGQILIDDTEIAADLFLNLVLGRSSKRALYGITLDPEMEEQRRRAAVALFLRGYRKSYSAP